MLQLKYGRVLDETPFVTTMLGLCADLQQGVSPLALVDEFNARPHLEFQDASHKEAFHLHLEGRRVPGLGGLRRVLRLIPGTACAVAVIKGPDGPLEDADDGFHAVAAFREGYGSSGTIVGR